MNNLEMIADLRDLLSYHGALDYTDGADAPQGNPELTALSLAALNRRVQRDTSCGATVEVDLAEGRVRYSSTEDDGTALRTAWFVFPFPAAGVSDALIDLEDRAREAWTLAHPDPETATLPDEESD